MRRKDREVTDPQRIEEIISACHCCRLGFCDGGKPYIVPLNFGFVRREDGGYTFYFHSAREGRKLDLIRQTGWAGFELDTGYQIHEGDTACDYSAAFQSVIGGGKVSIVEDPTEKEAALRLLMAHMAGDRPWAFTPQMLASVCVIRLDTEELSCKVHL